MPLIDQYKRDIMCRETGEVQRLYEVRMRGPSGIMAMVFSFVSIS